MIRRDCDSGHDFLMAFNYTNNISARDIPHYDSTEILPRRKQLSIPTKTKNIDCSWSSNSRLNEDCLAIEFDAAFLFLVLSVVKGSAWRREERLCLRCCNGCSHQVNGYDSRFEHANKNKAVSQHPSQKEKAQPKPRRLFEIARL